jgi:predicted nucleic acid-binding protein
MGVASLIDTNVIVYRFDPRYPEKQSIAAALLRDGLGDENLALPHQVIIEFVAAVSRRRPDLGGQPLLAQGDALQEAESLMRQFRIVYPTPEVLITAMRGVSAYGLSWFDAHLWACAECLGFDEILSEDFEHGRHYGRVRTVDPFLRAAGGVNELPALYRTAAV